MAKLKENLYEKVLVTTFLMIFIFFSSSSLLLLFLLSPFHLLMDEKKRKKERKKGEEKRPANKAKRFPGVGFFFSLAFTEVQMFYKQTTPLKGKRVSTKTERLRNIQTSTFSMNVPTR